jgi:hypothetical protein
LKFTDFLVGLVRWGPGIIPPAVPRGRSRHSLKVSFIMSIIQPAGIGNQPTTVTTSPPLPTQTATPDSIATTPTATPTNTQGTLVNTSS